MDAVLDALVSKQGWSKSGSSSGTSKVEELSLQRRGLNSLLMHGSGAPALQEFGFVNLVELDLARNSIACLKGLEHLDKLETLVLYMNKVSDGREVLRLKSNGNLRKLDCRLNIISKAAWFRYFVLQNLPKIENLDEQSILAYERRKANEVPAISHSDLNYRDDDSDSSSEDSFQGDKSAGGKAMANGSDAPAPKNVKTDTTLHLGVESAESLIDGVKFANEFNQAFEDLPPKMNEQTLRYGADSDVKGDHMSEEEEEDDDGNDLFSERESAEDIDEEASDQESSNLSLDQSLLTVLKYVRENMDIPPISKSAWEDTVEGLNNCLVKVVNCRKREKKEQNNALVHTIALEQQVQHLEEQIHTKEAEYVLLQGQYDQMMSERKDAEKKLVGSKGASPGELTASSQENNVYTKVPEMLLEAHNALIAANRTLLQDLEEIKARYREDEEQWNRNFEQLRTLQSQK